MSNTPPAGDRAPPAIGTLAEGSAEDWALLRAGRSFGRRRCFVGGAAPSFFSGVPLVVFSHIASSSATRTSPAANQLTRNKRLPERKRTRRWFRKLLTPDSSDVAAFVAVYCDGGGCFMEPAGRATKGGATAEPMRCAIWRTATEGPGTSTEFELPRSHPRKASPAAAVDGYRSCGFFWIILQQMSLSSRGQSGRSC